MFKFSENTLKLLHKAGWSEDRHFSAADEYIKNLEHAGFYVSDAVKKFLCVFGGLFVRHPHAKVKEKIDYFHFDAAQALDSGDPTWVSEEYSSRVGKKLCIIGEGFRRSMILCMSEDKKIYAGTDESLFFVGESPESAIEALCNGDDLKEIPEKNELHLSDRMLINYFWNLTGIKPYVPNKISYNLLNKKTSNIKGLFSQNTKSDFGRIYA